MPSRAMQTSSTMSRRRKRTSRPAARTASRRNGTACMTPLPLAAAPARLSLATPKNQRAHAEAAEDPELPPPSSLSRDDRPLSARSSHSDSDGMGSIPTIPNAQIVPFLLCHERFDEACLSVYYDVLSVLFAYEAKMYIRYYHAVYIISDSEP